MRWSVLILGSSLLAERYGIRLRNESAGAKKHRNVSRKKTCFQQRGIRNATAERNVIAWENKKQK